MHIELVSTVVTAPNTGAAGVALTGDSLTVKNAARNSYVGVVASWATRQVAGFSQLVFPSGHDTTRGYRAGVAIGAGQLTHPLGTQMELQPQEVLVNTIAGSNTAGDLEQDAFLLFYENFPGISARMISDSELQRRLEKMTTVESSITAVATGQYAEEAINADTDLLLANRDYAILGMNSRTASHSLTLKGPDLGNVRVGVPGNLRPELTTQWFPLLARATGRAIVPVINSGNRASTMIGFTADENAATTLVTVYLALLK